MSSGLFLTHTVAQGWLGPQGFPQLFGLPVGTCPSASGAGACHIKFLGHPNFLICLTLSGYMEGQAEFSHQISTHLIHLIV